MAIIVDIETVAIDGVEAFIDAPAAPSNYKDPEKIAEYIADATKERIAKAALYPWTARLACLGWALDDADTRVYVTPSEQDEATALAFFWRDVQRDDDRFVRPIIGFNHRAFDLPVLLARSLLLGVSHPALNLDRYRTPHVDLMDKLTWYGAIPSRSLTWFARRFGLPVEDTVTGADVAGLVAAGDWTAVAAHCRSDVQLTRGLAERLGYVRGGKAVAA